LLQKSVSGGLRANSRNIRLWTDDSLNQKCAWMAKFGIFFPAETPKIFLQQYRPLADSRTAKRFVVGGGCSDLNNRNWAKAAGGQVKKNEALDLTQGLA
jgi:hypothetical protein